MLGLITSTDINSVLYWTWTPQMFNEMPGGAVGKAPDGCAGMSVVYGTNVA